MTGASTNGRRASPPAVELRIELGSSLAHLATSEEAASAVRSLVADVEALLRHLGLEGSAAVTLATCESARPLRLWVDGASRPYHPALVRRAWVAVAPRELQELAAAPERGQTSGYPSEWVAGCAHAAVDRPTGHSLLFAFVRQLVRAVLLERPSCLLSKSVAAQYARGTPHSPTTWASVLGPLLDLGTTARAREELVEVIREGEAIRRPVGDTIEAAFARLRKHTVELHVHPATLARLLDGAPTDGPFSVYDVRIRAELQELFRELEQTVFFAQFGFQLPDLLWVPSRGVPEGMLAVKLDAWSGIPAPIVTPGERVVDAPPGTLAELGVATSVAVHPITGARCAVVPEGARSLVESRGLTTRGPIDWVVLNTWAELSSHAPRLFGIEDVEYQLARLRYQLVRRAVTPAYPQSELVFDGLSPSLVDAALERYSLGELTRIFRAMISESLSLRHLPGLLERLVQYDTVPSENESESLVLLDDRLRVLPGESAGWEASYAFLRRRLASYLSHRFAWNSNTLVAYVLDPQIETRAANGRRLRGRFASPVSDAEAEMVRDAVWRELAYAGGAPSGQVILTTQHARRPLRRLLEPELPDLPVLAYSELRADLNVQPLARILLDES